MLTVLQSLSIHCISLILWYLSLLVLNVLQSLPLCSLNTAANITAWHHQNVNSPCCAAGGGQQYQGLSLHTNTSETFVNLLELILGIIVQSVYNVFCYTEIVVVRGCV